MIYRVELKTTTIGTYDVAFVSASSKSSAEQISTKQFIKNKNCYAVAKFVEN